MGQSLQRGIDKIAFRPWRGPLTKVFALGEFFAGGLMAKLEKKELLFWPWCSLAPCVAVALVCPWWVKNSKEGDVERSGKRSAAPIDRD